MSWKWPNLLLFLVDQLVRVEIMLFLRIIFQKSILILKYTDFHIIFAESTLNHYI